MGTVLIITLGVGWAVDRTMRRVDAAHPETPLSHLPRRCRVPFQLLLLALLSLGGFPAARIGHGRESGIERALAVVLIASLSPDRGSPSATWCGWTGCAVNTPTPCRG